MCNKHISNVFLVIKAITPLFLLNFTSFTFSKFFFLKICINKQTNSLKVFVLLLQKQHRFTKSNVRSQKQRRLIGRGPGRTLRLSFVSAFQPQLARRRVQMKVKEHDCLQLELVAALVWRGSQEILQAAVVIVAKRKTPALPANGVSCYYQVLERRPDGAQHRRQTGTGRKRQRLS